MFIIKILQRERHISIKNLARLVNIKSLEVAKTTDVTRITGYVIGGVSPLGQKRKTLTVVCDSAMQFDEILVSGGRKGLSVGLNPNDLVKVTAAIVGDFLEHSDPKK